MRLSWNCWRRHRGVTRQGRGNCSSSRSEVNGGRTGHLRLARHTRQEIRVRYGREFLPRYGRVERLGGSEFRRDRCIYNCQNDNSPSILIIARASMRDHKLRSSPGLKDDTGVPAKDGALNAAISCPEVKGIGGYG